MQKTNRENVAYYILAFGLLFILWNLICFPGFFILMIGFNEPIAWSLILPGLLLGVVLIIMWLLLKNPDSSLSKYYDQLNPPTYAVIIVGICILFFLSKIISDGVSSVIQP